MSGAFRSHIVRFLSLFLALFVLNFSINIPVYQINQTAIHGYTGLGEAGNLLEILLDIDFDTNQAYPPSGNCEEESSATPFDILHHANRSLMTDNCYYNFLQGQHKACSKLKSRPQEVTSPPPKS